MNTKTIASLLLTLLTGLGLGWFLRGSGEKSLVAANGMSATIRSATGSNRTELSHEDGGRVSAGGSRHSRKGAENQVETEDLLIDPEAVSILLNEGVVDLERRTKLIKEKDPLSRVLRLNGNEIKVLNRLWREVSYELHTLRMENVRDQDLKDGGIWLGIESFAEGERLRQDFLQSIHSVLGDTRGKVFLDAIKAHQAFGKWGKTVGSGYVVRIRVQSDESHIYEIVEQTRADGTPGRKWQTSKIPKHLESMAKAAGVALEP